MIAEIQIELSAIALVIVICLAFFWKVNWIQDLTIHTISSTRLMAKYKSTMARNIGQLPPVYPNGWFCLLESTSLKKGQAVHVAALGQNFAVFRTESGVARIIDAYCPHLGANLGGGQVKGEELECPFHSWRFCGETGKCTSIPYAKRVPTTANIKVWNTHEVNGIIFVWYHAESERPTWWPEPVENIMNGNWQYHGRNEFYVSCHIQEIPENGADQAHFLPVHGRPFVAGELLSSFVSHSWSDASWRPSCEDPGPEDSAPPSQDAKHEAISSLTHHMLLFNRFRVLELKVEARQIGPGYVCLHLASPLGPICILHTVTPLQPLLQRVTHQVYAPRLIGPYAKLVMIGESVMFERDVRVWNQKRYLENPLLVAEDKAIKAYRRWYRQFYSENSPTYKARGDSLEW